MTDETDHRHEANDFDGTDRDAGEDPVLDALASVDPAMADAPPVRGSARHLSILEHAMTATTTATTAPDEGRRSGLGSPRASQLRRHPLPLLAAAAAIVAIVVVVAAVVVLEPGRQATPASAGQVVRSAATTTGDVSSLRAAGTYDNGDGSVTRLTSEIDGANYSSILRRTGGPVDQRGGDESTTVIGDTQWETDGSRTTKRTVRPEELNAPFPEASEAVVKAALVGSKVTDLGTEDVRGQEATHYRIQLNPASTKALAKLTPSQLARFELEYPQNVASLDVWVADDLIRRITVPLPPTETIGTQPGSTSRPSPDTKGVGTATIEFYDFGADITIRPPK